MESSLNLFNKPQQTVINCSVCSTHPRRYVCPKCQIPYCSLNCYKIHGANCTEAFYKENIDELLKSTKSTEEDKKNMTETLIKIREKDQLEQEELALLDSLEGVDLVDEEDTEDMTPTILQPIPHFSQLISKTPSPFLLFNLLDILYAYAYCMRYLNGDILSDIPVSLTLLYEISAVLSSNQIYESTNQCISSSIENSLKSTISRNSKDFSEAIVKDVVVILKYKEHILASLSDIFSMFGNYLKTGTLTKDRRKPFVTTQKKILFFLSWCNMQPQLTFNNLSMELSLSFLSTT